MIILARAFLIPLCLIRHISPISPFPKHPILPFQNIIIRSRTKTRAKNFFALELWIAREKLNSIPIGRPKGGSNVPPFTWASYCESIGLEKRTAARRMGEISPPHQGKQTSPNYGEVTQQRPKRSSDFRTISCIPKQRLSEYRKLARIAGVKHSEAR